MASMQHDFIHPRQLDDVKSIRAAIKSFTTNMKRMMLLMKDLGTTLEQVSHSFDALTSLSFSDDSVKQYVHHFSEEVLLMMEGTAFQNYNKLVHEEVLAPVEELKASLRETEKAAKIEKNSFDRYKKAKKKVDKQEKTYATKSKSLDTSRSYPTNVQSRDTSLTALQQSKDDIEVKFVGLVNEVEKVTATTLKRYLDLNAGYMTSVVDALTKTDPTVEEAVRLYREAQRQQRHSAIQQRCAEVDTEMEASYTAPGYRLDPTRTNRAALSNSGSLIKSPGTVPANGRGAAGLNGSVNSSPPYKESLSNPAGAAPAGPPRASAPPPASPAAAAGTGAGGGLGSAPSPSSSPSCPPPHAAAKAPAAQYGNVTQRGAFTVTATTAAATSKPPSHPVPAADSTDPSRCMEELEEDEDFGSVSQVGTAGKAAPPLYNFSRGPLSQVSSVRPQSGYVANENANLTNEFLRKMETGGLTASEVNATRPAQP